jgi:ribosomal protein S27E
MGMYDDINVDIKCPNCGGDTIAQSKDGDCLINLIDPTEVSWFKIYCVDCRETTTYSREVKRVNRKARKVPYSLDEVASMGYEMEVT